MNDLTFENASEILSRYSKRKKEILNYIKNISGNEWNYYGLHDFGIQLIENFFYKVEDIKLRSENDIMQILRHSELLPKNFSESIFINPAKIFPSQEALSKQDLWKIIVNKKGIKNCKVIVSKDLHAKNIMGGYIVYLLQDIHLSYEKILEETLEDVRDILISNRGICEDFFEIKFLKKRELRVNLVLSIEEYASTNDLTTLIAQALYSFQETLTPSVNFYSIEEISQKKNHILEEIFNGPTLENGFIDTDEIDNLSIKNRIHISECIQKICNTDNHLNISFIEFYNNNNEKLNSTITCNFDEYLFLNVKLSSIKVIYKGTYIDIEQEQISSAYDKISIKTFIKVKPSSHNEVETPDLSEFKNLTNYESLQFMFPSFMGLLSENLPEGNIKNTYIKQIKGYLLLFDQILCNYARLFDTIPKIFLNAINKNNNYKESVLAPKEVPGIESILRYPKSTISFINQRKFILSENPKITPSSDSKVPFMHAFVHNLDKINNTHLRRIDNCLSFILNMFGKKYYSEVSLIENLSPEKRLKKNIRIKKNILSLVNDSPTDESIYLKNITYLQKKIYALLDINQNKMKGPLYEFFENNVEASNTINIPKSKNQKTEEFNNRYDLNRHISDIKFRGNVHPLVELLMKNCITKTNFAVIQKSKNKFFLEVATDDLRENNIHVDTNFHIDTKEHAEILADNIVAYFQDLNRNMERIYIIEHILLRDQDILTHDIDHYSFVMTLVLPSWPAKFQSSNFKTLFNKVIAENIPAHIKTNVLWLSYEDFFFFEKLYVDWLNSFKENHKSEATAKSAKNLMGLIISLSFVVF